MSLKNDRLEFPDALISELKPRRECASAKSLEGKPRSSESACAISCKLSFLLQRDEYVVPNPASVPVRSLAETVA